MGCIQKSFKTIAKPSRILSIMRQARVELYKGTVKLAEALDAMPNVVMYYGLLDNFKPRRLYAEHAQMEVYVDSQDCITVAQNLYETFRHPIAVLSMASNKRPGGGVLNGASAQEEDIWIRTDACVHVNEHTVRYPMADDQIVYAQGLSIIRDSPAKNYMFQVGPNVPKINLISCAAPNMHSKGAERLTIEDINLLTLKINQILQTAAYHRERVLVLGAFGCGVFNNPPDLVAAIFKGLLQTVYAGCFVRVVFSVLPLGERGARNLEIFRRVFG